MRLLQKTIRTYFLYSFFVLLIAAPLFYFIIKGIVAKDVDKALISQKENIVRQLDKAVLFDPFDLLNAMAPDINLYPSPIIRQRDTLYSSKVYDPISKQLIPYRFLSSNVIIRGQPYVIQLKSSLVNNEDLIKSIVLVEVILLALIGFGLFLINENMAMTMWSPFYKTLNKLQRFRVEQDEKIELEPSSIKEFNDLNKTVQQLTERNRQTFLAQKEFIENASHEMQTPLALIQSKLELLMQTQPLTADQAFLISILNDAGSRLSRLNKSLLLLSKIDNNQYFETEEVSVNDQMELIIAQLEDQLEVKNIQVSIDCNDPVLVRANKTMIDILLNNLVLNAIRYNKEGGTIKIQLSNSSFEIINTSFIKELDKDKIFERFQKQGALPQSIGLGLAIVKRICSLYNYRITYQFIDPASHCFTVNFNH